MNTSRNLPICTSSPLLRVADSTRSRLTYVPLRLPTSRTVKPARPRWNSACRRDTVTSSRKMSLSGCRPLVVTSWSSRNRAPALGPRRTTSSAMPGGSGPRPGPARRRASAALEHLVEGAHVQRRGDVERGVLVVWARHANHLTDRRSVEQQPHMRPVRLPVATVDLASLATRENFGSTGRAGATRTVLVGRTITRCVGDGFSPARSARCNPARRAGRSSAAGSAGSISISQPVAVRVGVDQLGLVLELLVAGHHGAADRGVDLGDALGRLDLAERLARLHRGARLGQLDVDDVAERVLRVVGDADPDRADGCGARDPLVLGRCSAAPLGSRSTDPSSDDRLSLTSLYGLGVPSVSGGVQRVDRHRTPARRR